MKTLTFKIITFLATLTNYPSENKIKRHDQTGGCWLKFEKIGDILLLCSWFSGGLLGIIGFLCSSWPFFSMLDVMVCIYLAQGVGPLEVVVFWVVYVFL